MKPTRYLSPWLLVLIAALALWPAPALAGQQAAARTPEAGNEEVALLRELVDSNRELIRSNQELMERLEGMDHLLGLVHTGIEDIRRQVKDIGVRQP